MIHENKHRTTDIQRRLPSSIVSRIFTGSESSTGNLLRQRLGNQGIQRLMGDASEQTRSPVVQAKLRVSQPGDIHEQEADRVASEVMRMPDSSVRETSVLSSPSTPEVQRVCIECDDELEKKSVSPVQRKEQTSSVPPVRSSVVANIQSMRGGGRALPAATRGFFEPRFGADFSGVRVHTDERANATAKSIGAKAFTHGRDIAFASGQYSPASNAGQHLIAHELAHVVQQTGKRSPNTAGGTNPRLMEMHVANEAETVLRAFNSDDNHNLQSERFRGDDRLEDIFDGKQSQFLRSGSTGDAVVKVQQTLIELGFPLPKFGADGKFGNETGSAVSKFKAKKGISPSDPVVGPKTIGALDAELMNSPPVPTCSDQPVNMEAEPLPPIPLPSITKMNANELFELAKNRQVAGGRVPKRPPLGATAPTIENVKAVTVRTESDSSANCFKCIADWEPTQPTIEIFVATGDFSDEPKRSFPVQEQSVSGCPFETGGTFKDVIKRILSEAEPIILDAELEHWSDFVLTHLLITGRYLSNVRRLTPRRTHLRGTDLADCTNKVNQFLFETSTFPVPIAIPLYGLLSAVAVRQVFSDTTGKREEEDHSAISVPPMDKKPIFPNIDNQINPFTCRAFFRKFDKTLAPGVPGPPFSSIVEDKEKFIPSKRPWNTL